RLAVQFGVAALEHAVAHVVLERQRAHRQLFGVGFHFVLRHAHAGGELALRAGEGVVLRGGGRGRGGGGGARRDRGGTARRRRGLGFGGEALEAGDAVGRHREH